jgi:hypothetical protein
MATIWRKTGVPTAARGENTPSRTAVDRDSSRRGVASALARESTIDLAVCVRSYARRARADGDIVQDVVKCLMDLVRDATPDDGTLAKRSCMVADWAIAAYYDEPESVPVAAWRTEAIGPRVYRDSSASRRP